MSTAIQVKDLSPNQTYYFAVTAYNTGRLESDRSNEVTYSVPSPEAPLFAKPLVLNGVEDTPTPFVLQAECSDPTRLAQATTFTIVSQPSRGTLSGTAPNLTYTPSAHYHGADSFEYTVSDGKSTSASARVDIAISPVDDVPTARSKTVNGVEDTPIAFVLEGSDPDLEPLAFTVLKLPSAGVLGGTPPQLTYTPNANYAGSDRIDFTVTDGKLTSTVGSVFFAISPVNDRPVATGSVLQANTGTSIPVVLKATDVDNDPLAFAVTRAPIGGTLSGSGANLIYTSRSDFSGTDSLEFTASDGKLVSSPATITIEVKSTANTAPKALAQSKTLTEDSPLALVLAGTDAENNPLTYAVTLPPVNGTLSGIAPNLTYTPKANYFGSDSFEFVANDGRATSTPAKISLTITSVNDAPVANPLSTSLAEDTSVLLTLTGSDIEGSALTYAISKQPARGRLMGTPPSVRYVPNNNANGPDSFQFVVKDGSLASVPATVSLVVTPVNDTPVATTRGYSTAEDRQISLVLAATDVDLDPLAFAIATPPTQGKLSGTPPNLVYTPNANYFGSDSFTFTANDGTATSLPVRISISIVSVNDAPTAKAATVTLDEDTSAAFTLEGSDVETAVLTFIVRANPLNGTLSGTAPNLVYTPKPNFAGTDSMTFTVSDGLAGSAYTKVTFTVRAVNDAPIALANTFTTAYGTAVATTLAGTDVEKSPLTYKVTRAPARGTLGGTVPNLTYKPNVGFYGTDSFEFTVNDGSLTSAPATVSIKVSAPSNASPQGDTLLVGAYGSTTRTLDGAWSLAANDLDASEGQIELREAPGQGLVQIAGDGTFTYRHTGGAASEDSFTYVSILDGMESEPARVRVHVFRLNQLTRESSQIVLGFPAVPGVVYRVEGTATDPQDASSWQSLGEVTTEIVTEAEVPAAIADDDANRYFRITAEAPAGNITTETVGYQRRSLLAGAQTWSAPFQGMLSARLQVVSASSDVVTLSTSSLADGQWNPRGGLASHVLVASDGSRWWPVRGNDANRVTVDSRGSDMATALAAGETIEILRLSTALDLFGDPSTDGSALQPGDFVDFVDGDGKVSTLGCRGGIQGDAAASFYLRDSSGLETPANLSAVTFLNGQPIQIQKSATAGTMWFLGRVQVGALTLHRVGDLETSGLPVE